MKPVPRHDRFCLGLCLLSLGAYLLFSDAVRVFGQEVSRLLAKY